MAAKPLPPQDVLRQLLDYDPETGLLTWRPRGAELFKHSAGRTAEHSAACWNSRYVGKPALDHLNGKGYLTGLILKDRFIAHRVAFKMATGQEPPQIDHINGIRTDNRLCNLRAASYAENARNHKVRADNTSGEPGVYWHKPGAKWRVQIGGSPRRHIGLYDTLEEAIAARRAAGAAFGYHQNHGRQA